MVPPRSTTVGTVPAWFLAGLGFAANAGPVPLWLSEANWLITTVLERHEMPEGVVIGRHERGDGAASVRTADLVFLGNACRIGMVAHR